MDSYDRYKLWLETFKDNPDITEELLSIKDDKKEIEDRFYTELSFGTGGMRGILGIGSNRMNIINVRRATYGLAEAIKQAGENKRSVVIAFDSRNMSDIFAREAALVLCACGIPVQLFESLRPVPVLSFAVRYLGAIAGIVVTASHNPPAYNGYKVYWEDGGQLPPERADMVLEYISRTGLTDAQPMDYDDAIASGLLSIIGSRVDDAYISFVKTLSINPALFHELGDTLKLVYTPLHGSGNIPVRRLLREMGLKHVYVVPEQEQPDGNFPTVKVPNPENPETLSMGRELADTVGADLVFGTDPDCDRLGVMARRSGGEWVTFTGNQIGCVLLNYILRNRKQMGTLPPNGAVVKSIVSTELARRICDHYGVETIEVLTGFKFIAEQIELFEATDSHVFLFGFEESFGYLSGTRVRDKDAVNASMLVAEAAAYYSKLGMTLYDALQEIYKQFGYYVDRVTSVEMTGKDGLENMKRLMQTLRNNPPTEFSGQRVIAVRDYLTGIRTDSAGNTTAINTSASDVLYFELEDNAWLCVRPSGTEPKVKVYVSVGNSDEAIAAARADALLDAIVRHIK